MKLTHTAVLVVDIQADFTEYAQGALAAQDADVNYLEQVTAATQQLQQSGYPIIATQDWHPANHISFYNNHANKQPFDVIELPNRQQILWPPHCVQHSAGAELLLAKSLFDTIIQKGTRREYDSYSGFADDQGMSTGLHDKLKQANIQNLILYGIATEYCILATALDARKLGYQVTVIKNLCRGVKDTDIDLAWERMQEAGIKINKQSS